MIPVEVVENSMSGLMDQQIIYLLNAENKIILSSNDEGTDSKVVLSETGMSSNTHTEDGEWLFRKNALNNGKMLLLSVVPCIVLAQGCGKIIREMLLFYFAVCCLAYLFLRLGTRPFLMRIHKLDSTMEAVDQGILKPVAILEYQDELGKLTVRYNKMVQQIQCLMQEQYVLGKAKSEAELYALQTQISPHFLYNTLDMMNWMAVKGETEQKQSLRERARDIISVLFRKDALMYLLYWALISFAMGLFTSYYTVFLNRNLHIDKATASLLVSISYAAIVLFMLFTPYVVKKLGTVGTICFTVLLSVPFMLIIANGDRFGKAMIPMVGIGLFMRAGLANLGSPAESSLSMMIAPKHLRPAFTSVVNFMAGIVSIVSGNFTGKFLFATQEGYRSAYYIAAALYFLAALVMVTLFQKYNRKEEEA